MIGFAEKAINDHEEVLLFPSYGRRLPDGRWCVEIAGLVYDPTDIRLQMRLLLRILRGVMRIDDDRLENQIFKQRIIPFVGAGERGKRVFVRIGKHEFQLRKKSKSNGHFFGSIILDDPLIEELRETGDLQGNQLRFIVAPSIGDKLFQGRVHLLDENGLSVISDIDDTIKDTNVTSRKELVENTFFREFRHIDGIVDVYRQLAESGAEFHYVSSSPWQLVRSLESFIDSHFPAGTFHLRHFRLRDQMLKKIMIRRKGKSEPIHRLLKTFAQREFIFFGDSREKDPSIYAKAFRKFPNQCKAMFIRSFPDKPMTAARIEKINSVAKADICVAFESGQELQALIDARLNRS